MSTHDHPDTRRRAGWLPEQTDVEAWLTEHRKRAGGDDAGELHPVVQGFADELAADPLLRMAVTRMIDQVPHRRDYQDRHVRDVDEFLRLVNAVLRLAPEYGDSTMVMLPLAAVLDWTMATPAGYAVYRDPRVNRWLKELLGVWAQFLDGPESRYVLDDSATGWLSPAAREAVGLDQFEHDPSAPHYGFASWNDFFTRRLRAGVRPVADPEDDGIVANACESTPYAIATDVQETAQFWIKQEPYSVRDMLAGDPSTDRFVGGTVYQAFLSATDYHRWHSPVAGTVVRAFTVDGTYFSEADSEGSDAETAPDSQAYLAHVSARAVIVLEADEPSLGLVAFVAVGMLEVSSCVIDPTITPGRHLAKGEELGYFQYGGSTHCLLFEPGAVDFFATDVVAHHQGAAQRVVPVRSALAVTRSGARPGTRSP